MRKSIHLLLALVLAVLWTTMPALSASADAGSIEVIKQADKEVAELNDVITYTYTIINRGTVEIKNLSLKDDKIGEVPLTSDNAFLGKLGPGENVTAIATYRVAFGDLLAGSVKNIATVTGTDANGNSISENSSVVEVSTSIIKALLTRAQILRLSGVPGKGIDHAPGLQKPFNANSQADDHAGQKNHQGEMEQNRHREFNSTTQNQEQNTEQETNGQSLQNHGKGQGKGHNK